jgi:hypothetical protein
VLMASPCKSSIPHYRKLLAVFPFVFELSSWCSRVTRVPSSSSRVATGPKDVTILTSQVVSHPHMINQQQQQHFEIEQRQIEQMCHGSTPSQSVIEQQSSLRSSSTMIVPSPPDFALFPLDAMTSNPYMVPLSTGFPESPQLQSPSTHGKKNPRAATFDPSLRSDHKFFL